MSVPNQTPYNIYTANGLSTVFAYEFYLISASDIQVTINGTEVTSGYTVSGVGNTNGGEVTFLTAPANGSTVIFERVTPTYRLTDYQDNGDLLADTVNKDFDRLWMAIQRAFIYLGVALSRPLFGGGPFDAAGYRIANLADPVNDQDAATKKFVIDTGKINLARTLRVPESEVGMLPSISGRRKKILAFNDQGSPIAVLPESGSAADVMIELGSDEGTSWVAKLGRKPLVAISYYKDKGMSDQDAVQAAFDESSNITFDTSVTLTSAITFDRSEPCTVIFSPGVTVTNTNFLPRLTTHPNHKISGTTFRTKQYSAVNIDGTSVKHQTMAVEMAVHDTLSSGPNYEPFVALMAAIESFNCE
ncbi:phage tail fiber protein, partial [Klebsiella pneumoniae]